MAGLFCNRPADPIFSTHLGHGMVFLKKYEEFMDEKDKSRIGRRSLE